ncbi:MAG TPA: ATP-binding cassette domain-containing protein [Conexibacter sp.]
MTSQPLLEVREGGKSYGAVAALSDVDLTLHEGEILALLGDNGAGKSTLIKAISGAHRLDSGTLLMDGKPVDFRSPADARAHGIETVYQDLALFDNLAAPANFYVGRELTRPAWMGRLAFLRDRTMTGETSAILERLGVSIRDVSAAIGLMSGGQRQAIAVARAVAFASRVVILDEPTAALGLRESRHVLDLIKQLPAQGVAVILISHNLDHVTEVADNAIVLRRGRNVGGAAARPEHQEHLVSLIVGAIASDTAGRGT